MSQKKAIIVCDACKHEFYLDAVGIHEAIVQLNGVPVTLVYFACPKCNKIYRISIQDKRYYELVKDLEKTKKRIRKNHGSNNKEMARVLDSMVFRKKQRLEEYVDKVNKMFPGTFTFVASENNHKEQTIKYLP
jgi:phytoene dehydrogenase-like protein